jgi:hypothetical protein
MWCSPLPLTNTGVFDALAVADPGLSMSKVAALRSPAPGRKFGQPRAQVLADFVDAAREAIGVT